MADELSGIVQRMMDAGEPEANIASVIKAYKPAASDAGALTRSMMGDTGVGVPEGADPSQTFTGKLNAVMQGAAHPQSVGDLLSLAIPTGVNAAIGAAKGYWNAGARTAAEGGTLRSFPGRMMRTLYQDATAPAPIRGLARYAPNVSAGSQTAFAPDAAASMPTATIDRYMPNVSGAAAPMQGTLRMASKPAQQLASEGHDPADILTAIQQNRTPSGPQLPASWQPFAGAK